MGTSLQRMLKTLKHWLRYQRLRSCKFHSWFSFVRKFFHTALVKPTQDDHKLQEAIAILDAHSHAIQQKHYILRCKQEDVKLAGLLIENVIGEVVQ